MLRIRLVIVIQLEDGFDRLCKVKNIFKIGSALSAGVAFDAPVEVVFDDSKYAPQWLHVGYWLVISWLWFGLWVKKALPEPRFREGGRWCSLGGVLSYRSCSRILAGL